jgi:hypothetical protein
MGAHFVVLFAAISILACGAASRDDRPGHLEVRWTGADTGRLAGEASAEWCGAGKFLEIRAARHDSGVGVAIFPRDTIVPGRYRIVPAERADSSRPAATVALRWFEQKTVRGFRANTGTVVLERGPDGALSGRIAAAAQSVARDTVRLTVDGSFRDLRIRPATRGCAPITSPEPTDTASSGKPVPGPAAPDTGVH